MRSFFAAAVASVATAKTLTGTNLGGW